MRWKACKTIRSCLKMFIHTIRTAKKLLLGLNRLNKPSSSFYPLCRRLGTLGTRDSSASQSSPSRCSLPPGRLEREPAAAKLVGLRWQAEPDLVRQAEKAK